MRFLFTILCGVWCLLASAQEKVKAYRNAVPNSYNFWFCHPEKEVKKGEKHPLLVFLHGASLCGSNLDRVKRYGPMDAMRRGRVIDAYVLAPQNSGGSWKPEKIMKLIEWAEKEFDVDSDRIYVYGMSLGGYGTIDMCATYPDRIAAGMAICGGGTVKSLGGLARMPMWILHGTADKDVPVSASDRVVAAIKATGDASRLLYTKLPGVDHGRPARIFYMTQTYEWLFSHSLKDEGRPVNSKYEITPALMNNAYKDLRR